jgi:DNA-binding NarL/FixJ family response regulator
MRMVIIAESRAAADAIRQGLRFAPGMTVVGYADGRTQCAASVAAAAPDLVLIGDLATEDAVMERVEQLRGVLPAAKIVLFTADMAETRLAAASQAGMDAAVATSVGANGLGPLLRHIATGAVYHAFAPAAAAPPEAAASVECLTAREVEILRFAASGASNGAIARELWVTEQTIKFHLSNIYRKLGVVNRTEASRIAHLAGLMETVPERAATEPILAVA